MWNLANEAVRVHSASFHEIVKASWSHASVRGCSSRSGPDRRIGGRPARGSRGARTAVCAREPSHALDDPKPRCAASRAQSAEFFRQVLGRETDPVEVPEVGFMQALAEYAQMFMCTDLVRIRHVAFDDFSGHAGLVYTPTGLNV